MLLKWSLHPFSFFFSSFILFKVTINRTVNNLAVRKNRWILFKPEFMPILYVLSAEMYFKRYWSFSFLYFLILLHCSTLIWMHKHTENANKPQKRDFFSLPKFAVSHVVHHLALSFLSMAFKSALPWKTLKKEITV